MGYSCSTGRAGRSDQAVASFVAVPGTGTQSLTPATYVHVYVYAHVYMHVYTHNYSADWQVRDQALALMKAFDKDGESLLDPKEMEQASNLTP